MEVRRATLRRTEIGAVMEAPNRNQRRGEWGVGRSVSSGALFRTVRYHSPLPGVAEGWVVVRPEGLEPPRVAPQDPKSCASASSATVAMLNGVQEVRQENTSREYVKEIRR